MSDFAPPLPAVFDEAGSWAATEPIAGLKVVVFGGVPGSGKSALAEGLGRRLRVSVVSLDWLLGALTQFRVITPANGAAIGYELAITLGVRELMAGRSVIFDGIARQRSIDEQDAVLARWMSLARAREAAFYAIDCVCSDEQLHRSRMEGRRREIPGWRQTVDWRFVVDGGSNQYEWTFEHLRVDTVRDTDENLERVLAFVKR